MRLSSCNTDKFQFDGVYYHTALLGKDGKSVSANVVAVVQKDNKRVTYKIVTVYPDKKEK